MTPRPLYSRRASRIVSRQVLQNTPASGYHTVTRDFFTSIGLTPLGGMVRRYKTRKGKAARLLVEVLNIPPARFKTGQSQQGAMPMNAATTPTPTPSALSHFAGRFVDIPEELDDSERAQQSEPEAMFCGLPSGRWVVRVRNGVASPAVFIHDDSYIVRPEQLAGLLGTPGEIPLSLLPGIVAACNDRLEANKGGR